MDNASRLYWVKRNCSTLNSVFEYEIPEICDSFILRDLIGSFEIERPIKSVGPPACNLYKVLEHLRGPVYEALVSKPLKILTIKTLFLLYLATAKMVGEIQALSCRVAFKGPDFSLSYHPGFVGKTKSEKNPLPRSFLVRSLEEFVGDLPEERLVYPVRSVRAYLDTTTSLSSRPRSQFVLLRVLRDLSRKCFIFSSSSHF